MPEFEAEVVYQEFDAIVTDGIPSIDTLRRLLGTAKTVAMAAGVTTTLYQFLVDQAASRTLQVTFEVTGGGLYRRTVVIDHDGTDAADATAASGEYDGDDIPAAELTTFDNDVSGSGATQVCRLRAALDSGGTAYITEIPHRPPQRAT